MTSRPETIDFHGSLLRSECVREQLNATEKLKYVGGRPIPGALCDLAECPGLVEGTSRIVSGKWAEHSRDRP